MFASGIKHLVHATSVVRRNGVYKAVAMSGLWRLHMLIVSVVFEEQELVSKFKRIWCCRTNRWQWTGQEGLVLSISYHLGAQEYFV